MNINEGRRSRGKGETNGKFVYIYKRGSFWWYSFWAVCVSVRCIIAADLCPAMREETLLWASLAITCTHRHIYIYIYLLCTEQTHLSLFLEPLCNSGVFLSARKTRSSREDSSSGSS